MHERGSGCFFSQCCFIGTHGSSLRRWSAFSEDSIDRKKMERSIQDIDPVEVGGIFPVHSSFLLGRAFQHDACFAVFVQRVSESMFLNEHISVPFFVFPKGPRTTKSCKVRISQRSQGGRFCRYSRAEVRDVHIKRRVRMA